MTLMHDACTNFSPISFEVFEKFTKVLTLSYLCMSFKRSLHVNLECFMVKKLDRSCITLAVAGTHSRTFIQSSKAKIKLIHTHSVPAPI